MSELRTRPLPILLGLGLLAGCACLAAGQLALGMGHGWDLPRRFGALSLILYPLALARWGWVRPTLPWSVDLALTFGIAVPGMIALSLVGVLPPIGRINASGWTILVGVSAAYAVAGMMTRGPGVSAKVGDAGLLALGVILDVVALADAMRAGPAAALALPWAVLWLSWQIMVGLALARRRQTLAV